jgi:hypothetical protein
VARSLESPLDWRFIINQAIRHGVLSFLNSMLRAHGWLDCLPTDARRGLEAAFTHRTTRSLSLLGELARILQNFRQEAIPALPFKGPVVSKLVYGDFLKRSYCDLDILVREADLDRACQLLIDAGYRPPTPLSPRQKAEYFRTECAVQLQDDRHGFVVELHWRFNERNAAIALPVAAFWQRAQPFELAGATVPSLCREDLCLYLCVHGAKHRWERLEWIACLAELIRTGSDLNWSAIEERAAAYRIERLLHLGLLLAQGLFEIDLPPALEQRALADRAACSIADGVAEDLFSEAGPRSHYHERAMRYLFLLRTREHWGDRVRVLYHSAVRPPHPDAQEWLNLPPQLAFLHHVIRPVRLISQYSAVAWRHYSGQRDS